MCYSWLWNSRQTGVCNLPLPVVSSDFIRSQARVLISANALDKQLKGEKKVKGAYSFLWQSISELRGVTCHMGSPNTSERAPP